jgi:hypothetical protein
MMDWDDARKDAVRFFRELLGSGYVDSYYEAPADELIEILKLVESQATPQSMPKPVAAEDEKPTRVEIAQALDAHATLLRHLAERLR